jgi:hypothetical protein
MSFSDWLGLVQAAATVVAVFFAWRTTVLALDSRREAKREQQLARLEQMRAGVGELERLHRFGGRLSPDAAQVMKENQKERLVTLLRSFRSGSLPGTEAVAHWSPGYEGADDVLEAARLELDKAIDASFSSAEGRVSG